MSGDIKAGDLVRVARENYCGCPDRLGIIFVVDEVRPALPIGYCRICKNEFIRPVGQSAATGLSSGVVNTIRLIKIDPPALPESVERREELPA